MKLFKIGNTYYRWSGDQLVKAYKPPKQTGFRNFSPPKPKSDKQTWLGPDKPSVGPSSSEIEGDPKTYTPDTSERYFNGNSEPEWGKHFLDPDSTDDHSEKGIIKARKALHDAIVDHQVHDKETPDENQQKVALFMMGGPAAGKSSMVNQMFTSDEQKKFATVNPDDIKDMLPEYRKGVRNRYWPAAANSHEESSYLSKRVFDEALNSGKHIMIDGTGGKLKNYKKQLKQLKDAGYKVGLMAIDKPQDEGVKDAVNRAYRSGRFVPEQIIKHTYQNIPDNYEEFKQMVDGYQKYKAPPKSEGRKGKPSLQEEGGELPSF